jgi:PPOX class probable F420-dependent enzyme
VLHPLFPQLPAQLDRLAIAIGGKVNQALQWTFELDPHHVEGGDSFEQLELRAADRVASLLVAVTILGAGPGPFRFVLRDPRLVLQLWQESGELSDLRDDPANAGQLSVRLIDRVAAEPLHRSTIARKPVRTPTPGSRLRVMEAAEARRRFGEVDVARLATVGADGRPHIVPVCFVLDGDAMYFAVDAKPKRTAELKRLRNIAANPAVSGLADHYEDDWTRLWWVRLDGTARVVTDRLDADHAIDLLAARYEQYRRARPPGPVVAVAIERWSGWSAS